MLLCFTLFWTPHMAIIGRLLGVNWFSKLMTAVLLIGESAFPIYVMFHRRLKKLGKQLFDRTLQLKLGRAAAPAGELRPPPPGLQAAVLFAWMLGE
jgi:hypothetical protein